MKASVIPNHREKIAFLQKHDHPAVRLVLSYVYDESKQWDLGDDWEPTYQPNIFFDQESGLYQNARKLDKFLVGGPLTREKKRGLFVQLLEMLDKNDAQLIVSAATKRKIPWRGLGPKVIREAYPGLLPEEPVMAETGEAPE